LSTPSATLSKVTTDHWLSIASALSRSYAADVLLSDTSLPGEGRSYVAIEPSDELIVHDTTLRHDIEYFAFSDDRPTIGFLSYEYGAGKLGIVSSKRAAFPRGHCKKYGAIVTHDATTEQILIESADVRLRSHVADAIASCTYPRHDEIGNELTGGQIRMSLSRDEYIERVRKTLSYIRSGDVYQLSLSLKYSVELDVPLEPALAIALFSRRPAVFYAYFTSGPFRILSTSPECFIRVRDGHVLSRPIKGTLRFDNYDPRLVSALQSSPKEDAELSMIVDLIRNDISRNCDYGSVAVSDHKSVFAVDNLLQMYSTVEGKLRPGRTCIDLLLDAFPGGSVTGCPKKRAMELIDDLEPHSRDIYCGSFFVIKDKQTMESSIAIRTGYYNDDTGTFSFLAGSGIVVESDPVAEYNETVAKAEKFLNLLRC